MSEIICDEVHVNVSITLRRHHNHIASNFWKSCRYTILCLWENKNMDRARQTLNLEEECQKQFVINCLHVSMGAWVCDGMCGCGY